MRRLALIGSSDLARLIAYHAESTGWAISGFIDNRRARSEPVADLGTVIGAVEDVESLYASDAFDALAIGVGYLQFVYRQEAFERFKGHIPFANVISDDAYIDPSCRIGEGCVVLPGCVLDHGVELGDNVLLNTGVTIAHHSSIGMHSFIGPAAAIAGKVQIGSGCFIGLNSTVIDHRIIADGVTVGAATLVTRDLDTAGTYVGAPARLLHRPCGDA